MTRLLLKFYRSIAVCLLSSAAVCMQATVAPAVYILDGADLMRARERIAQEEPVFLEALADLVERAEVALGEGPFSVIHKTIMPPSGNKQDYLSFGPYWWPNPDTADGLPYIRRDGEVNPSARTDGSDSPRLGRMASNAEMLALAYFYTGREAFGERAALLLRVWFLDTETRMNPHLQFGQAIPGRVEGRGIGILDTARLTRVIDTAGLLRGSPFWSAEDHSALQAWFSEYLKWLQTSSHGADERRSANNHGTFYDAQIAAFALFTGDVETARTVLESAKKNRITAQIEPDGRQPLELRRPIAFHYSRFNLDGMVLLGRLGEHVGVDLWNFRSAETGGIRGALDYVVPYLDPSKAWPHGRQVTDTERARMLPLLRQAYRAYRDPAFLAAIEALPDAERNTDPTRLRFPASLQGQTR